MYLGYFRGAEFKNDISFGVLALIYEIMSTIQVMILS